MALISVGGLATGLDTNSIVEQLVALERRRGVGVLQTQRTEAKARSNALQTFNGKVLALLAAVEKLKTADDVVARKAASSNTGVLAATAGGAAQAGSTTISVGALARVGIAASATGTTSSTATIATSAGTFSFKVGSGATQSVAIDATTTLDGLAASINALGADVSATVLNVGTASAPDFRLRLTGQQTGADQNLTIVNDDTSLAVGVTQTALDAEITVSGIPGTIKRSTNTFDDVIPGVTVNLAATGGPVTVTVTADADAVAAKVEALVTAYNDLKTFVASESQVTQDTSSEDREVSAGPLAFDGTVRGILDSIRNAASAPVEGLDGDTDLTLLAQLGITTQQDGTLKFDASVLKSALASDEAGVGQLLGGTGAIDGVADRLRSYLNDVTGANGLIAIRTNTVSTEISTLEERIGAGERNLTAFEENLRAQFASLEVLVSSLKSQGNALLAALGGRS